MISIETKYSRNIPFHVMAKPRGSICNLKCDYCFYLKKEALYPKANFQMDKQVLESYIKDYIESQDVPEINFSWQGGEPTLMGLDFFKKVVELQQKHNIKNQKILNSFQTNGTLITKEWASFFKTNNFLIGISIDGPESLHDRYRFDKKGRGSFQIVEEKLEIIRDHQVDYNILACVNSVNAKYPLEVYQFFRDKLKAEFIQFIPIVIDNPSTGKSKKNLVSEHTVSGKDYGNFLVQIFNEWVRNDVGKVFVQIFDSVLSSFMGHGAGICVFEKVCGRGLAMEFNGDVYSCDHFVTQEHLIGKINRESLSEMVTSDFQRKFGLNKWNMLTGECRRCSVLEFCHGGCPKNRIISLKNENYKQNYLCDGYKKFFTHVKPFMQTMAEELSQKRPASNIMQKLKNKNFPKNTFNKSPRRNEPCYCGSGKKFKKCHGSP